MEIDRFILNSHGSCDMCGMELLEQGERVATTIYVYEIDYMVADQNRIDLLKEQEQLQAEITKLKADVESLKCCGNCERDFGEPIKGTNSYCNSSCNFMEYEVSSQT